VIQVTDHPEGCVINVRAQPGARRNGIVGEQAEALKVAVSAPPEKGRANEAIVEVLADALQVKRSQIELIGGGSSKSKRFLLRGLTAEVVASRLRSLLDV
jgi:uncharacterized protein (TIGR00251 family)